MIKQGQNTNTSFKNLNDQINFEHRFWLQILGDHMRFIEDQLAFSEKDLLETAKILKDQCDNLLQFARQQQNILNDAINLIQEVKKFKFTILNKQLTNKIKIGLTPTFINYMINKLEEYQNIIDSLSKTGKLPVFNIMLHHKLWLLNSSGNIEALIADLDSTEKQLKMDLKFLKKKFKILYNKTGEFSGYLRALNNYPQVLQVLNKNSIDTSQIFLKMLGDILVMTLNKELLSRFDVLVPDHMIREELYYLSKLGVNIGDPTAPRFNS